MTCAVIRNSSQENANAFDQPRHHPGYLVRRKAAANPDGVTDRFGGESHVSATARASQEDAPPRLSTPTSRAPGGGTPDPCSPPTSSNSWPWSSARPEPDQGRVREHTPALGVARQAVRDKFDRSRHDGVDGGRQARDRSPPSDKSGTVRPRDGHLTSQLRSQISLRRLMPYDPSTDRRSSPNAIPSYRPRP
jgi:hypothetical protein